MAPVLMRGSALIATLALETEINAKAKANAQHKHRLRENFRKRMAPVLMRGSAFIGTVAMETEMNAMAKANAQHKHENFRKSIFRKGIFRKCNDLLSKQQEKRMAKAQRKLEAHKTAHQKLRERLSKSIDMRSRLQRLMEEDKVRMEESGPSACLADRSSTAEEFYNRCLGGEAKRPRFE